MANEHHDPILDLFVGLFSACVLVVVLLALCGYLAITLSNTKAEAKRAYDQLAYDMAVNYELCNK